MNLREMAEYLLERHWENVSRAVVNGTFLPDAQFSSDFVSVEDFQGGGDGDGDGVRRVRGGDQDQGPAHGKGDGDDDDGPVRPEVGPM